ncbi:unnamed protein product [Linum tenue]|uniref:Transmembrane protein n=1 Tax=Linum tenue TaxID=586396 RepID=A0AAV0GNV7_9ROSI|nr:unnamed protein product [Linum tenue]
MARKLCSAAMKLAAKEVIQYVERVLFWIERIAFFTLTCFLLIRLSDSNKSLQPEFFHGLVFMIAIIVFFQGWFFVRYLHKTRPETIGVRKAYNLMNSVLPATPLYDALQFYESLCVIVHLQTIVFLSTIPPSFTWEPDLVLALASFAGLYIATFVTRFCTLHSTYYDDENRCGDDWTAVLKARQHCDNDIDRNKAGGGDGGRAPSSGEVVRGKTEEEEGLLGDRVLIAWQEEVSLIQAELSEATAVVEHLRRRNVPSPS